MVNEFIVQLMARFSQVLGYNDLLVAGFCIFFIFSVLYALGLPRYLTIPAALVGLFIFIEFGAGVGLLAILGAALGVGFLLYMVIRG